MIGGTGAVIGTSEPHLQSLCDLQGGCLSWDFTGPENCYHHLVSTKAHCHFMDSCINIPTHHVLWISFAVGNISKDNRRQGRGTHSIQRQDWVLGGSVWQQQWMSNNTCGLGFEYLPLNHRNPHGTEVPTLVLAGSPVDKSVPLLRCNFLLCPMLTETILPFLLSYRNASGWGPNYITL